jgi:hypothetical protein
LISCLCVTNRPGFEPWVRWNYTKQTHPDRELVIVSGGPLLWARREALRLAKGTHVAWFDDDDWQHPERLALSWQRSQGGGIVGSRRSFFLDVRNMRVAPYVGRTEIFNSLLVPIEIARSLPAAEGVGWLSGLRLLQPQSFVTFGRNANADPLLFFWLVHGRNVRNANAECRSKLDTLIPHVPDWRETELKLALLR